MNYLFENEFYIEAHFAKSGIPPSGWQPLVPIVRSHLTGGPAGDICEMRGKGVPIDPGRLR